MSKDEKLKGNPVAIAPNAISASPTEPAFVAPPKGAPVYHGFVVLEDVSVKGFTSGAITDFEAEPCEAGDAFVVAPDAVAPGLCGKSPRQSTSRKCGPSSVTGGAFGSFVPVPDGQPRKCSQESGHCVTRIESPLGVVEAVAVSSSVGSTVVTVNTRNA